MTHLDDNDVVAMVEGTLRPERLRELEAHLDGCSACRQLVAVSAKSPGGATGDSEKSAANGQQLGRYTVLKPVGAGAMGVVYAAYDPELDRRVALKLLHAAGAAPGDTNKLKTRLLREAQAMARLSHPNVIAVHDVGTVNDQVFVAMEFVEGMTLAQWIARNHPWREVLRVFVLAGRGLAAAHAAGLVHRDFKPDNVLIGDDGRVRVTDFGLAHAERREALEFSPPIHFSEGAPGDTAPTATDSRSDSRPGSAPDPTRSLSVQGALIGSPAYMAPEQLRGEAVDARADQFSFCVALYEAIYRERPFSGKDPLELRTAIDAGPPPEPAGARLPKWVRRVLQRGLASKPGERFASLDELLDALEADPAASRRQLLIGIATIALLAGAVLLVRWQAAKAERGCSGAEEEVRAVFSPELRQQAKQAFLASKLPYAAEAWTRAESALDQFGAAWSQQRTEACEATAVRKEQSPELLDLRMACLNDRLRGFSAAASLFAHADNDVIARAAQISQSLPHLEPCSDARTLRELPPPTPEQKDKVNQLRDSLAKLRVLISAGKRTELFPLAQQLADQARAIGYGPLEAEALYSLGLARIQIDDLKTSREVLLSAAAAALRARVDTLIADSWNKLIVVCIQLSLRDDSQLAAMFAQAAVARLHNNAPAQAQLELSLGMLAQLDANMKEQEVHDQRAVALLEPLPHGMDYLDALDQLAFLYAQEAKLPQALEVAQRLLTLATAQLGPAHISVGEKLGLMGDVLSRLGQREKANEYFDRAVKVIEAADGDNSLILVDVLRERSANSGALEKSEASIADARRALQIILARLGPGVVDEAISRGYLGDALFNAGRSPEAAEQYRLAIAIFGRTGDVIGSSDAQTALARILLDEDKVEQARTMVERTLHEAEGKLPPDHPLIAQATQVLGRTAMQEKNFPEARRLMSKAAEMLKGTLGENDETWNCEVWRAQVDVEAGAWQPALMQLDRISAAVHASGKSFDDLWLRALSARAQWGLHKDPARVRQLFIELDRELSAQGFPVRDNLLQLRKWEKDLDPPLRAP